MSLSLIRIDDRLIHGQVVLSWSRYIGANLILVADDKVARDMVRKTLLQAVAPQGIRVDVLPVSDAADRIKGGSYDRYNVLMLFTTPGDVLRFVGKGISIKSVNIGGISYKAGKRMVTKSVAVDDEDIEALKKLGEMGIEVEVRVLPEDSKIYILQRI
ncbi:PTS system mannose/fructose/N-acetylgalactosamine-transporter subunit IIB [Calorimonas adulescens]|uniref:PTS sugar transporter subunit IIB n=1 Tax=Calorimonas adulescens TaxID=2606906 RepID=A0A5D8QFF9_9THEO|nr:PTS sugar transporter subunit IIB [Calorimonas adulescens]TZE82566.1 PTS sugar transporter subunit IIB [Calorimonas adulescens]